MSITWTTEQIKLSDLIEWEFNPVKLSEHDAKQIQISIEKFGLVLPLVANRPGDPDTNENRRLIDGHQRKTILLYSEIATPDTLLDVRIPSRKLTNDECSELSIRLRKNTGEFDFQILATFEKSDLLDWGFRAYELDMDDEPIDDDLWVGMPEYESEDVSEIQSVKVNFLTQADIDDFAELVNQRITEKTRYIWFPRVEKDPYGKVVTK